MSSIHFYIGVYNILRSLPGTDGNLDGTKKNIFMTGFGGYVVYDEGWATARLHSQRRDDGITSHR